MGDLNNNKAKTIMVVDDDKSIREVVIYNIRKEGYNVLALDNGTDAVNSAIEGKVDLVVMDIMMPGIDGVSACKKIKEKKDIPVILLTAKSTESDKVIGLEMGADDYMTKPFGLRELIARIKANLRKYEKVMQEIEPVKTRENKGRLEIADLVLNIERYEVRKGNRILDVSLREFDVLKYLIERKGKIFSREELLQEIWGYEHFGDKRIIDVTISRIREKIGGNKSDQKILKTKRGIGYYISDDIE